MRRSICLIIFASFVQLPGVSINSDEYGIIEKLEPLVYEEQQAMSIMSNGPMDSPWPMKCHDVHHTSQSPYSTADNPYIEKWRFYFNDWFEDTPVIDSDSTIYAGLRWELYAIYPNGTLKWKYQADGLILGSTPAIAVDGTIYVGSWDDYLHAINPDGTRKWAFYVYSTVYSSPAIAMDGTIYIGIMGPGTKGRVIAINPNGTEKWHYDTEDWIVSDPAISDDGTVYIGSGDSYLYALYPNGTLRWRFKTGDWVNSHPSIADDGTIYFSSFDGYLYALYPNGIIKWKFSNPGSAVNSVSIAEDGTLYLGGDRLWAIYSNGTMKWNFGFSEDKYVSHSSPAISADGTIYVGVKRASHDDGYIYAVNSDGTEKWHKYIARLWVQSSPSIAEDGTVYIGSSYEMKRGYIHAFGNVESNSHPNAPSISGPTNAKAGLEYWYTFVAIDPDNNPIQLFVDWGDGVSVWIDWFASGETMWAEHAWTEKGDYTIKAKVKDVFDEESDWGYLEVTVPKNKAINFNLDLLERLLEQLPLLSRLYHLIR